MAEEVSSPLLSLVRELDLIDDLQYEEVAAEFKRSGTPVIHLLQDFGIMQLDDILQVMANYWDQGRYPAQHSIHPRIAPDHPGQRRAHVSMPARRHAGRNGADRTGRSAGPGARGRNQFCGQKGRAGGRGRPGRHERAIEQYYGQETEDFSAILKELGADADIAREVSQAGAQDDERLGQPRQQGAHREVCEPGLVPGHSGPRE